MRGMWEVWGMWGMWETWEVRHLGVEEDERGDRLDVVQLRQQGGEVAAVRQRRPRHRRAVLVKLGLRGVLRDVDDLEVVAAGSDRRVG